MIYIKWLALTIIKLFVMLPTLLVALWTRPMPHDLLSYSWGSLWGTFDNPPQGDEGFVLDHAFFVGIEDGWGGFAPLVTTGNPFDGYGDD